VLEDGRQVDATMALLVPYAPRLNDELLVVGRSSGEFFVVGVIRGRGGLRTEFHDDFRLVSLTGNVFVRAARRLSLQTPRLELQAHRMLQRSAERVVLRSARAERSARKKMVVMAGVFAEVTQKRWFRRAKHVVVKVAKTVRFNGKTARIG
jgi:hypothetical protein